MRMIFFRSFVRSFVRLFVCLFVLEGWLKDDRMKLLGRS